MRAHRNVVTLAVLRCFTRAKVICQNNNISRVQRHVRLTSEQE